MPSPSFDIHNQRNNLLIEQFTTKSGREARYMVE